ncbi:MAG: hypothetical protein NTY48_03310, partial [Candidatus Diapherotrites archaeon]|nr:hypothetical protein [Candidatus Diapherotrites archaeon]
MTHITKIIHKKEVPHKIPFRELKRKSIHITFGILILLMIYFLGAEISAMAIAACIIIGTIISFWIKNGKKFIFFKKIVEKVERENEKSFPGKAAVMFFISALILLLVSQLLLERNTTIVLAALSVQVFADAGAALIGMTFGKYKLYKKKTFE